MKPKVIRTSPSHCSVGQAVDKLLDVSDSGRQLCGTEVSERGVCSFGFCQALSLRLRLHVKTSLRICPEESDCGVVGYSNTDIYIYTY